MSLLVENPLKEINKFTKLFLFTQEEIDNLNYSKFIKIEYIAKTLPQKKNQGPDSLTGEFLPVKGELSVLIVRDKTSAGTLKTTFFNVLRNFFS